jgi:hypothetical protein
VVLHRQAAVRHGDGRVGRIERSTRTCPLQWSGSVNGQVRTGLPFRRPGDGHVVQDGVDAASARPG